MQRWLRVAISSEAYERLQVLKARATETARKKNPKAPPAKCADVIEQRIMASA